MGHLDSFQYALRGMLSRQTQSYLTILGVVIGIASIVAIVSIGQGISSYVQEQMMALGTDYVSITPGTDLGLSSSNPVGISKAILTSNDLKIIDGVGGVKKAYGQVMSMPSIEFGGEKGTTICIAFTAGGFEDFPMYKLREGRYYRAAAGEAIIGGGLANDVFKRDVRIGDTIKLNNASFRVVGILEKGSGMMAIADSMVAVDTADMQRITGQSKAVNAFVEIDAKLLPGANPDDVAAVIAERLRNAHKVTAETQDFTILTPAAASNIVGSIIVTLNLFLGGLAGIALIVGGVGIMNTMFMAVTERTREIGILKAVGARDSNILEIFILESGMIGLVGGVIGCAIGWSLSYGMNLFGVPSNVDLSLIGYALAFSFVVGMVSGFIPARVASSLEPVEALRYE